MSGLEPVAVKAAGPALKMAYQLWGWATRRAQADHQAISAVPNMDRAHSEWFVLTVAVGPSRQPKPLRLTEFPKAARAVAAELLPGPPPKIDYSGTELVRFVVRDADPAKRTERHMLTVRPSGLIELRWGLRLPITDGIAGPLPVGELMEVIERVHMVAQRPVFQLLHQPRRGEKLRRLDWRVGLTTQLATNDGQIPWSGIDAPRADGFERAERTFPYCPRAGYAADLLQARKASDPVGTILQPILEELLVNAGYIDVQPIAAEVMEHRETARRRALPAH